MEHTLYNQINPYVRYVNYLENRNNSNHVIPWRSLLDYEILFVTRGQITVQTKTDKFTVKENQFHIMSPNVEHTRYFENNLSCDYFNMHLDLFYDHLISDFSVIDTYIHFKIPPDYNKRHNKVSPELINVVDCISPEKAIALFRELLSTYRNTSIPYKQILLKSISLKIIHQIILSCDINNVSIFNTHTDKYEDLINKFIDFVENNYKLALSVNDFVHDKGISVGHFIKIFKQKQGITPNEFIIQYRIAQAKFLINSGLYYIYEISTMVGYQNEFYFSRIFKKREGCSPSQYLEKNKIEK